MYDEWTLIANYGVLKFFNLFWKEIPYTTIKMLKSEYPQPRKVHYTIYIKFIHFFSSFFFVNGNFFMNGQSPNCNFFKLFLKILKDFHSSYYVA